MSRAEQYEIAIAAILAGVFGASLFESYLQGTFDTKELWTLALIMVSLGVYGLLRLYIHYRKHYAIPRILEEARQLSYRSSADKVERLLEKEGLSRSDLHNYEQSYEQQRYRGDIS